MPRSCLPPRSCRRSPARAALLPVALLLALMTLLPAATARADQPQWSFAGQLPPIFQMGDRIPAALYSPEGRVLDDDQIARTFTFRRGDRVVLIRDAAVVAEATVGEVVAQRHDQADQRRLLYFRPEGVPAGVAVPAVPPGPEVLADADYDLWVFTDQAVEVLAPDPALQDLPWGVHDYCVRVGGLRFGIVREDWPGSDRMRGWQVYKLDPEARPLKVMVDYTWQQAARR